MRLSLPRLGARTVPAFCATIVVVAIAASTTFAQFGTFDPSFNGELWGVRHELTPADGGVPTGVAYSNGTLFVVDGANHTVLAYDSAGNLVSTAHDDWNAGDSASPVFGFRPNQLLATSIDVDGSARSALLVSDGNGNRVVAFDTTGEYLFTMRLERPSAAPLYSPAPGEIALSIGELAMPPGAQFHFTRGTQTLTLSGAFAGAWFEQIDTGAVDSGAMVLQGPMSFPVVGAEFQAIPTAIKRGNEHDSMEPAPQMVVGVAFDKVGNLYMLDAFTERLHVYGPSLTHLFAFGTPVADGTSAEFHEPWGMAFWPDATGNGGRLFINDTYKSRVMVYRPFDGPDAGAEFEGLQLESIIKGFLPAHPAIFMLGIALDPSSGSIALTDFAEDNGSYPRAVVLQQPRLAAFNLQVLDAQNAAVQSVCTGADYKIRFSLTVPSGRNPVNDVVPQLLIGGLPALASAVADDVYPSPMTLSAGEVATYTYTLTAPDEADGDIAALAGATASNTSDISTRAATVFVADCAGETDPSTITATPGTPPQVSGWTPVFDGETFTVTLTAQDNDGIESIEYQLEGANDSGEEPIAIGFDGAVQNASAQLPMPDPGRTTLTYRVRDGNAIWSGWRTLSVRTKRVVDRNSNENTGVEFKVGDPEGTGFSFSVEGLPAGVTFSPATGQFGGVVSFDANNPYSADAVVSAGVYDVVVTETATGGATSSVSFTWTVNNINRHPTITPVPASALQGIVEGQHFDIPVVGVDPDGDKAFFTFNGHSVPPGYDLPSGITIDPELGTISGTFPLDSKPSYVITVGLSECAGTVNDNPIVCAGTPSRPGLATLMEITVSITNVNQKPAVNSPGPQSSTEGETITPLQIVASDPDLDRGDSLTFLAANLPPGLAIDAATGLITGTVGSTTVPNYAVVVKVKDLAAIEPVPSVTFNWTVSSANEAPTLSSPNRVSNENETIGVTITHADADGDALTFSVSGLPAGFTITSAGLLSGTFSYESAGDYVVTVTAFDGTVSASTTFNWTVNDVNRPPVLNVADRTSVEGDAISLAIDGTDLDHDALTFSMNGLPPSLTINPSTGVISGTFNAGSAGVYTVNVGVVDRVVGVVKSFRWTVTSRPANVPPVCTAASASPGALWPPNHKPVSITVAGVVDPDGGTAAITFTSVLQDESTNTTGDGNTTQDAGIENSGARVWVRAERKGDESSNVYGRVYIVGFTATDAAGASCTGSVLVGVPHDQGNHNVPIASPGRWNSITGALVLAPPPTISKVKGKK